MIGKDDEIIVVDEIVIICGVCGDEIAVTAEEYELLSSGKSVLSDFHIHSLQWSEEDNSLI